jgi:hypothetical protein
VQTEFDDYTIDLESGEISVYTGDVRAIWFYYEEPLVSDILVTTGDYSDPECEMGQTGHRYWWQGCNPEEGTIHNIHAVPTSPDIDDMVHTLNIWDEVSIVGYEVDTINYDDGSWWTDAGCNTLLITDLCLL